MSYGKKKKPKPKNNDFEGKVSTTWSVNLGSLEEDVSSPRSFGSNSSNWSGNTTEDTQEIQITACMKQLNYALDAIADQQKVSQSSLLNQEGRLSKFENQVETTNEGINRQCRIMNRIMGKS